MNLLLTLLPLIPSIISSVGGIIGQTGATAVPAPQSVQTILQADAAFIKQAQQFLNEMQTLGLVSFGAPLATDGIAGPQTNAALQAVVAKYMPAA